MRPATQEQDREPTENTVDLVSFFFTGIYIKFSGLGSSYKHKIIVHMCERVPLCGSDDGVMLAVCCLN